MTTDIAATSTDSNRTPMAIPAMSPGGRPAGKKGIDSIQMFQHLMGACLLLAIC